MWHATCQVVRFEGRRTQTRGRFAIWLGLAAFPSLLMILLRWQAQSNPPGEVLALMCYYLVVQVGCMLGLLLWATPAIGSELESQTWAYLALRPHGRTAVLLGKYLVAAAWTASAGVISAVGVAYCSEYSQPSRLAISLVGLVIIASLCYAALYLLIGVVLPARATVIAVVYTLLVEGALSTIPAAINKFTVCYRLRALLAEWVDLARLRSNAEELFGYEPVWQHLACLAAYTLVTLGLALWIVRSREYPPGSEA